MQGVGFRITVVELARRRVVTGYVQNVPDGDVVVVAEGEEAELLRFLDDLRQSRLGRYVTRERIGWMDATGSCKGFEIRYA